MATLYDLTGDLLKLYEMAEDPEVDEQALADTIEAVDGEFEAKAEGYAKVIRQLKADAEAFKVEEARLKARKQACLNSIDRIQGRLEEAMKATGKTKFKTPLFSFGIQKNPPSVVIDHPELVPGVYMLPQEPKFDKTAIKYLLDTGDAIACHFAHIEQSEGLRIR